MNVNLKKIVKQLCIGGSQSFQANKKQHIAVVRQTRIETTRQRNNKIKAAEHCYVEFRF